MGLLNSLKEYVDGNLEPNDVYYSDNDDIIKIQFDNKNNKPKSLIILHFNDKEEYYRLFLDSDDRDNNNIYFFNVAFNNLNYNNVFIDPSYHSDEEWKEGYIYREFNNENQEKFKNILKIVNKKVYSKLLKNEDDTEPFKFMMDRFERQISELSYEYSLLYENSLIIGMKGYIERNLCDMWDSIGIYKKKCGYQYLSTASKIIKLWEMTNSDDSDGILDVLHKLNVDKGLIFYEDLGENFYEYYDQSNFDSESFNSTVSRELDRIMEIIEDEMESGELQKNSKVYEKLNDLGYEFNKWYKMPKQKNYGKESKIEFLINDVDDGKLKILQRNGSWGSPIEKLSMNLDDFFNFLYHPTLFESRI